MSEVATFAWSTVTTALDNVGSVLSSVIGIVADNPLLMFFMAVPVLGAGISVFSRLVHSVG